MSTKTDTLLTASRHWPTKATGPAPTDAGEG